MGKLDGQVALISGGARGQGEAQARLFAREGAAVAIGDVLEEDGNRVAESIIDTGGQAMFHKLDVSDQSNWAEMVDATTEQFGKLSLMINNAGILRGGLIERSTVQEYLEVIKINQVGVWLGIRAAINRCGKPAAVASSTRPRPLVWKAIPARARMWRRSSPCAD